MSLSTFSAYLSFAVASEQKGLEYFVSIIASQSGVKADFIGRLKTDAEKNIRNLQMILRENVTELVMEPCESLNEENYVFSGLSSDPVKFAMTILDKQREFCRDAAKAVNLREVKRAFEKLSEKKSQLYLELKDLAV
ncbi:MAG: hypothetical protein HQM09_19220 [Candidatus Riflebacteria bacterium]|nr:hypothetical protein [Candidatus Riflebacteria bacterium]